jgi:hypothetical protein
LGKDEKREQHRGLCRGERLSRTLRFGPLRSE